MIKKITTFLILFYLFCSCNALAQFDHDAYITYKVSLLEKTTGTYEQDGFVFFIADIEIDNKRVKKGVYEGKAMLKVKDLIKKYLSDELRLNKSSLKRYRGPIRKKIDSLIATNNHFDFNMKNLHGRVLVNQSVRKNGCRYYRYVFSVALDIIKKKKKELSSVEVNAAYLVRKVFLQAKNNDQHQELISYYLEMGLWEDAIYFQRKILSATFWLVNYYQTSNAIEERKYLRKILSDSEQLSDPAAVLKRLPGNIEALDAIINGMKKDQLLEKIVLQITKLPAISNDDLQQEYKNLNQKIVVADEGSSAIREYAQILSGIQAVKEKNNFSKGGILYNSVVSLGHLEIDNSLSKKENNFFLSAQQLFRTGGNKQKIQDLLIQSILASPRHADSWNYLGALMTASNRLYEAIVFHTQAYFIDNSNLETMANIADCYLRLGKKKLAMNYAVYMEILNQKTNNWFVDKIILKIKEAKQS